MDLISTSPRYTLMSSSRRIEFRSAKERNVKTSAVTCPFGEGWNWKATKPLAQIRPMTPLANVDLPLPDGPATARNEEFSIRCVALCANVDWDTSSAVEFDSL